MSKLLAFLPYLAVFAASLYNSADLDLGWHLEYGQYFVENHQVLTTNVFSSEMTDYRYPNTSWASDVLLYLIFSKAGFVGVTVLGAMVITLTFYFFAKAAKLTLWDQSLLFPLLVYLQAPVNAASYRAQLLSFLFLGILFYLLTRHSGEKRSVATESKSYKILSWSLPLQDDIKRLLLIPFLFLIWANSHGEYLTGLALFGIFVAGLSLFGKTRSALYLTSILALSILATLVNPFGINIYLESIRHFGNPLQKYVISWLPFETFSILWWNHLIIGILVAASIFFLIRKKKFRQNFPTVGIVVLLFFLTFWSRRYAWPFYYFSLFPLALLTAKIKPRKIDLPISITILVIYLLFTIAAKSPLSQFTKMSWENYCRTYVGCSPKAAQYLVDHNLKDNLYTFYDWGGWLIANYPQVKPSMDGRMALWRDKTGAGSFEQYYALEQNWADIDKSKYNVVLISPRKPLYWRLLELTKENRWDLKYRDDYAGVFVRKTQKSN